MGLVVIIAGVWAGERPDPPDSYERIYERDELPGKGKFVDAPREDGTHYYYVNEQLMWGDPNSVGKHSGLYKSTDGGKTWRLHCAFFEIHHLIIHPKTGILYAAIWTTWLANNREGHIVPHQSEKVIMSEDGRHWIDISPSKGHVGEGTRGNRLTLREEGAKVVWRRLP